MNNIDVGHIVGQIAHVISLIIGYGLMLLILAAVLQRYGFRVPYVPGVQVTELAYLTGAWWLYRGGWNK